jgi:hypothetical protein
MPPRISRLPRRGFGAALKYQVLTAVVTRVYGPSGPEGKKPGAGKPLSPCRYQGIKVKWQGNLAAREILEIFDAVEGI